MSKFEVMGDDHDDHGHDDHGHEAKESWTAADAWGSAIGAIFIVTAITLVGAATIPFTRAKNSARGKLLLRFLVSFGTGALIGDAFIHLIPHGFTPGLGAPLTACGGVYMFFLLEKVLRAHGGHNHSANLSAVGTEETLMETTKEEQAEMQGVKVEEKPELEEEKEVVVGHIGWINLSMEAFHNFIDGLAIGATFTISPELGWSTTLAVIFHEIPQELGDFAVLIKAGFTVKRALLLNLAAGTTAILGAIIGVAIGTASNDIALAILPLTAGGFLYMGLSVMVPILMEDNTWQDTVSQLVANFMGIGVMVLLTVHEEQSGAGHGGHEGHDH